MFRGKPTEAQIRRFQAQSREEQIAIIKQHLEKVFNRRFADQPDSNFEHGRDHAQSCFIANRMAKYIRSEDNSVRGFYRRYQNFVSTEQRENYIASQLSKMIEIPVPLPPQFVSLSNYSGDKRFLEINYQGTKATISDGTMTDTFPYYEAYSPLVDHAAIFAHLWQHKAFLGADDGEATHSLVLDTEKNKIYIATRRQAARFLEMQLPQTPEERKAADEKLDELMKEWENRNSSGKTLGDLQKKGMFSFLAPVNDRSKEVNEMCRFLDGYVHENVQQMMAECFPVN